MLPKTMFWTSFQFWMVIKKVHPPIFKDGPRKGSPTYFQGWSSKRFTNPPIFNLEKNYRVTKRYSNRGPRCDTWMLVTKNGRISNSPNSVGVSSIKFIVVNLKGRFTQHRPSKYEQDRIRIGQMQKQLRLIFSKNSFPSSAQTEGRSSWTIIIQRLQKCEFDIWITEHEIISIEIWFKQTCETLYHNLQMSLDGFWIGKWEWK